MHKEYKLKLGHQADFKVKYRFYTESEGGRKTLPHQGYRSDFWYEHPEHSGTNQVFMISPEFENEESHIILEKFPVSREGKACMWVINPPYRSYHTNKIHVGLIGYFMEGNRRVAECEVLEIIGLDSNPRK